VVLLVRVQLLLLMRQLLVVLDRLLEMQQQEVRREPLLLLLLEEQGQMVGRKQRLHLLVLLSVGTLVLLGLGNHQEQLGQPWGEVLRP
jgi:hypothetical protein